MYLQPISLLLGVVLLILPSKGIAQRDTIIRDTQRVTEISWPVAVPNVIAPSGDVKLKRCGKNSYPITGLAAGDTLEVDLFTKDGTPLKYICLLDKNGQTLHEPIAQSFYNFRTAAGEEAAYTLQLRAPFRLKRTQATIKVLRHPLVLPDTITFRYDTLYQLNAYQLYDTIISKVQITSNGDSLLSQKSIRIDKNGQIVKQEKSSAYEIYQPPVRTLRPQGNFHLRQRGNTKVSYADFSSADSLFIQITGKDDLLLKRVAVLDEAGNYLGGIIEEAQYLDTIVIGQEERIDIFLQGQSSMKSKFVDIQVQVKPPYQLKPVFLTTDSIFQIKQEFVYDTVLFTIADLQEQIAPTLNIEGRSVRAIDLKIPLKTSPTDNLMKIVFWFGLDYASVQAYTELEATVPADWAQPGVPLALGAYGLGHPINLPRLRHTDLDFFLLNRDQKLRMDQGYTRLIKLYTFANARETYGELSNAFLRNQGTGRQRDPITGMDNYRFFLCFKNSSTINTYPLAIKIVGYYRNLSASSKTTSFINTSTSEKP